jgi:hypothetical protein
MLAFLFSPSRTGTVLPLPLPLPLPLAARRKLSSFFHHLPLGLTAVSMFLRLNVEAVWGQLPGGEQPPKT